MGKRLTFLLFLTLLGVQACDKTRVFDEYHSVSGQWHKDSVMRFTFEMQDSLKPYNLFLNLRNSSEYPFRNIYLITELTYPHGKVLSDTLQYEMAAPSGEWLGTGFGEVKENKLWYKEQFLFDEKGDYTLEVQHAMRRRDSVKGIQRLEGITEIGFRIENNKQQ